ncbi:MAG TPA: pilus assembly PilX N-terminal domain-containing protein, partial [Gemmatimonadales bacterium]|nr:pilus assembly PilX N-terminal domain-containing protein [Gemmatimonadales bacterium]
MTHLLRRLLRFQDQRGAVLPLAMMILLVLSAVLMGLSVLTGQEPLVAGNHLMIAQAQAMAEAGIARALWALSHPDSAEGVAWPAPAPAPYDGSQFIPVAAEGGAILGGFRVTIVGEGDRQRQILAIGLVPGNEGPLGQARQEISATAIRLRFPTPPAGLTVRGDLAVGPGAWIDASGDGSCGPVAGTWSTGVTTLGAASQVVGSVGAGAMSNQPAVDFLELQTPDLFDAGAFTATELNALKAVARARGTYFQGSTTFDARHPLRDGLIFVDTTSGHPINAATPVGELATVSIGSGAGTGPGDSFRGWIVANGSVSISGTVAIEGLIYAADRFSQTGAARLTGAAMAGHVRSTTPSVVDARPGIGAALVWSCETGRTGAGKVPQRWMVKP